MAATLPIPTPTEFTSSRSPQEKFRPLPAPVESVTGKSSWFPVAWFPDGTKFIANALKGNNSSVWLVTLLGNKQLLRDDAWASSISPDGSLIAYHSHMDYFGGPDIWFMNERGESPRKVFSAERDSGIFHVSWAANGRRLAYMYQRPNANPEVDTLDLGSGANNRRRVEPVSYRRVLAARRPRGLLPDQPSRASE